MKECKIVQDLMPNYIDKLTTEESNNYIEEHLKNCEECTQILNNMKEELKLKSTVPKEEIDYMKKARRKMKVSEKLVLVVLLLVLILLIVFWREAFSFICYTDICRKYLYWQDIAQETGKYIVKQGDSYSYYTPEKMVNVYVDTVDGHIYEHAIVYDSEFEGTEKYYSKVYDADYHGDFIMSLYSPKIENNIIIENYPYYPKFNFDKKLSFGELISTFFDVRYITILNDEYVIDLKNTDDKVYLNRKTGLINSWGGTYYYVNVGTINEEVMSFPDLENEYVIVEDYESPNRSREIPVNKISNCEQEAGTIVSYDFSISNEEDGSLFGFMKTEEENIMIRKVTNNLTYKKLQEKWSELRDFTDEDFTNYYVMLIVDTDKTKKVHYSNYIEPEEQYGNIRFEVTEENSKEDYQYSATLVVVPNNMDTELQGASIFIYKIDIVNN